MAFSDSELFARLIKCEAGGEGDDMKEHRKHTNKKPLEHYYPLQLHVE